MKRWQAVLLVLLITGAIIGVTVLAYGGLKGVQWSKLWPASKAIPTGFYEVTAYVDGDTFKVDMNGTTETIRLIGVDTPETKKPNTPVQCYGPEASAFTKKTLLAGGNSVRLEADPKDDNRDQYGRLLRYVYLPDGTLLEQQIIEGGYGFAYTLFPFSKKQDFETYQATAQAAYRGLWTFCQPTLNDGKWQTNNASH